MNKKILISLTVIGVVAAIAIGGTIAYFNDTETSAGNIFVAGSIDLKVDHKYASYNDNPCIEECVEDTSTNLILNGSFEVPEVTNVAKWEIFPNGYSGLVWAVEWESTETTYGGYTRPDPSLTEYHENVLGSAQDGDQYTELDSDWFGPGDPLNGEPALIKIYQNIPTVIGTQYTLHYWYSPRPNIAAANNVLKVRIDGSEVANHSANGGGTTNWTEYTYTFTASGATTKVEFAGGGTADSLGTFLDNVKLHPYDCTYQIIGGTCTLWEEKDLGEGDYYWDFDDLKPGDYGVNVISLHAYSNDAYACLITHDIIDVEDTVIDPEIEAGDDIASIIGELSQFIKIFAWEDKNYNGVYEPSTEGLLLVENTPFATGIVSIPLIESNTKYIGIAWCAGTQSVDGAGVISCDGASMGDIAQTDIMTASITAYAEQQRNNSGFDCGTVVLPQ
ncbi:MAG: TasA family protein [Candidatus Heimdallarchaeota archaeon]